MDNIGFEPKPVGEGNWDPNIAEILTNKTLSSLTNTIHADLLHYKVKHTEGVTLLKGTPLRFVAWDNGEADILKVSTATDKHICIGIAGMDLENGVVGGMVVAGEMVGIDTSTMAVGSPIFVGATGLTSERHSQQVGICLKTSVADGVILANVRGHSYLEAGYTGYDRENLTTLPVIEFCVTATSGEYRRIMPDGTHSEYTAQTTFGDGITALADRTWCIRPDVPADGFGYRLKNEGIYRYSALTQQSPATEGRHILTFDADGLNVPTDIHQAIVNEVITSIVYCDGQGKYELFADERHGMEMTPIDHERIHMTTGCIYQEGIDIQGLVDASETYNQTTSGVLWDEDKMIELDVQATHPFIYRNGTDGHWLWTTPSNRVALSSSGDNTTVAQWNQWTGTEWQLTDSSTATDYIIMHFLATNNSRNPIVKVVGQSAYATAIEARKAIEKEVLDIHTGNLPSPELKFLYSIIVKQSTELDELEGGETFVDFRRSVGSGGGVSSSSSGVTDHSNLTGLEDLGVHPIGALTGVDSAVVGTVLKFFDTSTSIGLGGLYFTTGAGNTNIGHNGLGSNTTGTYNTNIGHNGLFSNVTGYYNTNTGSVGLYQCTGSRNTNTGYKGLFSNVAGDDNTNTGYVGLYMNTGSWNINTGGRGLYFNTGNYNTNVGYKGLHNSTEGSNLTGLGANTNLKVATDSNCIVVGSDAVGAGSDTTTFGTSANTLTVMYGSLSVGAGHSIFGTNSVVIGATNTVGEDLVADTDFNVCIGENCKATGKYCIALGDQSEATGLRSLSRGYKAYSFDYLSTAIGRYATSDGRCSFALGEYVNTNNIDYGVVFGAFNIQKANLIFCIGNGTTTELRSNRLEQYINGDMRLPTLLLEDIIDGKSVTTVEYVHTPKTVTESLATCTPNLSRTVLHEYNITEATTIANPTNALKGQTGTILIAQGAAAFAITLGTVYQLVGTLTEVANETTMLRYTVVSTTKTILEVVTTY